MKCCVLLAILAAFAVFGCMNPELPKSATIHQKIPQNAKIVCLFFDDGWQNQYDVALPILIDNNFKATFGIITDVIGAGGTGIQKYMGAKEVRDLFQKGMDVASHSKTHPHLSSSLSNNQLYSEIVDSKKQLEKLGVEVRTFVYPYYEWDIRDVTYVKSAGYQCARSGLQETTFNLKTKDTEARYHVDSIPIVQEEIEEFKQIVTCSDTDSVICLTYHYISDTGPVETSTRVADFTEQMHYLKISGFTVVLLPDLFE